MTGLQEDGNWGSTAKQVYRIEFEPILGKTDVPDYLYIEFYGDYDTSEGSLSFPLTGKNSSYATCEECALVFEDTNEGLVDRIYMAKEGLIGVLEDASGLDKGLSKGRIENLKLVDSKDSSVICNLYCRFFMEYFLRTIMRR